MTIEAMKQALEALEELNKASIGVDAVPLPGEIDTAMDALRAINELFLISSPIAILSRSNQVNSTMSLVCRLYWNLMFVPLL